MLPTENSRSNHALNAMKGCGSESCAKVQSKADIIESKIMAIAALTAKSAHPIAPRSLAAPRRRPQEGDTRAEQQPIAEERPTARQRHFVGPGRNRIRERLAAF